MNFESRNPATGELLGVYREHDKAETDARLQRAWDGWRHRSRTPLHERIAFLTRLAELLHVRRALEAGATRDELRQVGLLALTTLGFPTMIMGMTWIDDIIQSGPGQKKKAGSRRPR